MKRIPILRLLLTVLFLGGLLLGVGLWYPDWLEAAALGLVLLGLLTVQVIVVRRHLFNLPPGRTDWAMPAARRETPRTAQTVPPPKTTGSSETGTAQPATETAPSAEEGQAEAPPQGADIDATLFSRFRAHLEQMEQQGGQVQPPGRRPASRSPQARGTARAQAVSDDEGEVVARVQLSSRARAGTGGTGLRRTQPAEPPPLPEEEGDGPDLFADLRPSPPPAQPAPAPKPATPPAPAEPASAQEPPAVPVPKGEPDGEAPTAESAMDAVQPATPPAPEPAQGPGPVPEHEPEPAAGPATPTPPAPAAAQDTADLQAEAAALLRLAEEAAGREDWEAARAGLENYLAHLAESPNLIDWRGHHLQVRLAVRDGDANRALQGFEAMLKAGQRPTVETTPPLLDALLAGARPEQADSLRVSMLVRILALFRQRREQRAMDIAYGWIEEAQEKVGDERRLLQYLRNHLEIRKALGDVPGQLELIDQIGNRCFQLGLTEEAQTYYALGLKLRGESSEEEPETLN